MASNVIPVRIAHGWAIAWLDLYQTPAVVAESFTSSIKGFFGELMRGKNEYPNAFNPQNNSTNRLGRARKYKDADRSFAFGSPLLMSDDSDIEIVYIKDGRQKPPANINEFIMSELSITSMDGLLEPQILKAALRKYEVEATDQQISDMIQLAQEKGLKYIIDECKKTS